MKKSLLKSKVETVKRKIRSKKELSKTQELHLKALCSCNMAEFNKHLNLGLFNFG